MELAQPPADRRAQKNLAHHMVREVDVLGLEGQQSRT